MNNRVIKDREVHADHAELINFWIANGPRYFDYIEPIINAMRTHERSELPHDLIIGIAGMRRRSALSLMLILGSHLTDIHRRGDLTYTIEWWHRIPSDVGKGNLVIAVGPPGLYELAGSP